MLTVAFPLKVQFDRYIDMYKNHPSIRKINLKCFQKNSFSFNHVSARNISEIISNLDSSKAYQKDNIPPTILKEDNEFSSVVLAYDNNRCIDVGIFPPNLKNSDVTPTFKKDDRLLKENYRPISILPTLSKVYERFLHQQMYEYFDKFFSQFLCGYRKGHSTQHALLYMLEKLKMALDSGMCTGILMTDLSKAFDCLSHELMIAKLYAYGFSKKSLNLINDYFQNRKQRTKIRDKYSSWRDILYGVFQGSIVGRLLFNIYIYINDFFFFTEEILMSNYTDDNSPFEIGCNANEVIKKLEEDAIILIQWFTNNFLKPNPSQWHLLLSDINNEHCISISNQIISNSETERILGVTFDNNLNFNVHISKLCKQAGQKLHALGRVSNFMSCTQRKIIMNALISSQINYCPLIWMGHDRTIHKQLNRIHHWALSIVYRDYTSSFVTLLEKS